MSTLINLREIKSNISEITDADATRRIDFEAETADASVTRNKVLTVAVNAYVWIQRTLVYIFTYSNIIT